MKNFQKNTNLRRVAQSKPFLFVLGIVILFFAWNVFGFWNKLQETNKNKKIIENKIAELQARKANIGEEIDSLNTVEGKEKVFRENLGLVKEGENSIIIVEDKNQDNDLKSSTSNGFFSFFKNLFK